MINPLVLHRVVADRVECFEDIPETIFKGLLANGAAGFTTMDRAAGGEDSESLICLTFDDGNSSDFERVYPALQARKASATFFVVPDWLGRAGFLTRAQVRELHAGGMQVGSHSMTHQNLRHAPAAVRQRELTDSRKYLEDLIGAPVTTFAFPYGAESPGAIRAVFEAGYVRCCTSRHGIAQLANSVWPRNSINSRTSVGAGYRALRAGAATRLMWTLEDAAKSMVKRQFPRLYPAVRTAASVLRR
jgi:peptidoglycan/xylan/chitin deacetylase (PgdA/CDA1 family)